MNRLDRYILINYIKSFILGMAMFFLIFLLAESIKLTSWVIDGKFTLIEAMKYLMYGMPEIITNTAPLGILLGSLLSISNMAKQLEITAMKTGGISFFRIAFFPMIFSFLVASAVLWINYDILGKFNYKKSQMKLMKLDNEEPIKLEKNFVLIKLNKNKILYSGYVNKKEKIMKDIEIIEVDNKFENIKKIYTATEGKIIKDTNKWELKDLKEHNIENNTTVNIDSKKFNFEVAIDDILADPVKVKNLTMPELREKIVYFSRVGADSLDLLIDFYYRISFGLSSFIMCFIGMSLGSHYVRGGAAVNIGISVLIGYSYYGLSTILKSLAVAETLPVYLACFLPLILYFIIGIKLFKNAEY